MTAVTVQFVLAAVLFAFAVGVMVGRRMSLPMLTRASVVAGWVGVVCVAGLAALETVGGPAAVAAAGGFGALAVVPLSGESGDAGEMMIVPVATALTAAAGAVVASLMMHSANWEPWRAATTLYVVLFASLGASIALFGAGAFRRAGRQSTDGNGWLGGLICGLVIAMGPLTAAGFLWAHRGPAAPGGGIPLVTGDGHALVWSLPPELVQLSERAFAVSGAVPVWMLWSLVGLAGVSVLWAGIGVVVRGRLARLGWGLVALAIFALSAVLAARSKVYAEMPEAGSFVEKAEMLLTNQNLPQRIAEQGAFSGEQAHLDWWSLLPPGLAMLWSGLVALGMAWIGTDGADEETLRPSVPSVRACLAVWTCWLVGALTHWRLAGVIGFQSPSEWVALGTATIATGVSLVGVGAASRASDRAGAQARLSAGAGIALLVVLFAVSAGIWMGTPPFLAIPA